MNGLGLFLTNSSKVPSRKIFKQEITSVAIIVQLSRRLKCMEEVPRSNLQSGKFFSSKIYFQFRLFKLKLSKVLALEAEMCFRKKL